MRLVLGCALVLLLASCGGKQHLVREFGSSYDAAFAAQRVRADASPAQAITGLDSQEAAITSDNYRGTLAPKGKEVTAEPTIILAPPTRDRSAPLAPSVPKE